MYRLQPIYNIKTRELYSYELLFQQNGTPVEVGFWDQMDCFMFEHYLPAINISHDEKVRINVNLTSSSAKLITDEMIEKIYQKFNLMIEWSEISFDNIDNEIAANKFIGWRDKFGIEIAFDDVCTNQCFLSKVALLRPDMIKLDGNVFRKSLTNAQYRLVSKVAKFACYLLGTAYLVEWIESEEELDFAVNTLNAEFGQGFYMDNWKDEVKSKIDLPQFSEAFLTAYLSDKKSPTCNSIHHVQRT